MALSQTKVQWITKLSYQGEVRGHRVMMDTKGTKTELGMTPKELVLAGLCGCTGMDVISILTSKYKLPVAQCDITASATSTEGSHPVVWSKIELEFNITGDLPEEKVLQSVTLSMTKYCGVSAMLSKACPITYSVIFNGKSIGSGLAKFD